MVTDDERREVARRLQGQAKKLGPNMDAPEFAHYTADVIDVNECMTWYEMELRLADLIEPQPITGDTSDGYHTFNELYDHRAKLFSVIVRCFKDRAWKSKLHHDGTMYDGMFIVGIETPQGQATYHYDIDPYWDMFDCKELVRAPEWDGHTPEQAISRIASLRPYCDRNTPQKVAEDMFGKMRHSTKEEADAYDAMLKSKSVEIHPVDRDALLALADEMENVRSGYTAKAWFTFNARRIREALGAS